jgi:hypothetical protein
MSAVMMGLVTAVLLAIGAAVVLVASALVELRWRASRRRRAPMATSRNPTLPAQAWRGEWRGWVGSRVLA